MNAYEKVIEKVKEIKSIQYAMSVLGWDQETYMPPMGSSARGEQLSVLASIAHEKNCNTEFGQLIEECLASPELNEDLKLMLREIKRDRDQDVKIPAELVKKISLTTSKAFEKWVEAKKSSRFSVFSGILGEMTGLKKEMAEAIGYQDVPYDAMLDLHEPGLTVKKALPIISRARDISRKALEAIKGASRRPDGTILTRRYPEDKQLELSRYVVGVLGFDLNAGRIDRSEHPFTTNFSTRDVRLTTRFDEHFLQMSLYGTIHECGHGLYEQGLPNEHEGTPFAEAVSLGIHESQSRFWENMIGRSPAFIRFLMPKLRELFPEALANVSEEAFCFAVNDVKPSLIRVEADEITYNLHIALRFEIEQELFVGNISVQDLPDVWNSKMHSYLGIKPGSDSEGLLQDVHWSHGSFGYFPTYLLGNLYGAQWLHYLSKDIPDLEKRVGKGDLELVLRWMREKIHQHGRKYRAFELVQRVTGEDLNPQYFEEYLKERFGSLYQVKW